MPSSTLCVAAVPARRYVPATRAAIGLSGGRGDPGWAAERPRRHAHGGPWERVVATTYGVNGMCCEHGNAVFEAPRLPIRDGPRGGQAGMPTLGVGTRSFRVR